MFFFISRACQWSMHLVSTNHDGKKKKKKLQNRLSVAQSWNGVKQQIERQ